MKNTRLIDLENYLRTHFPDGNLRTNWPIKSEVHVRYELGAPYANGTDERIEQVNYRAGRIIEACFQPNDDVLILINDWQSPDPMFGNTTPHYLYELLGEHAWRCGDERMVEEWPDDDTTESAPIYFKQSLIPVVFGEARYKEVLAGIANYEQGREPSIGQLVYFISMEKDVAFYMYDDRGCLVFSDSPSKIRHLYEQLNDWIVDYWRGAIDAVFRGGG